MKVKGISANGSDGEAQQSSRPHDEQVNLGATLDKETGKLALEEDPAVPRGAKTGAITHRLKLASVKRAKAKTHALAKGWGKS